MSQKGAEDKEAQIELLQNMKMFLTDKVKQSVEQQQTNQKDISILKDMLKLEKNMNAKKEQTIKDKDDQLKGMREESLEQQQDNLIKINELELQIESNSKKDKQTQDEIKKLKMHKRVLKDEVVQLRQRLADVEGKLSVKGMALKNLGDFFKKQTEGMNLVAGGGDKHES